MTTIDDHGLFEREMFLSLLSDGIGEVNAGIQVGWTPAKTRKIMAEPDMALLVQDALAQLDESIELALVEQAKKGNMTAIQMWLHTRRPERWPDVKRIQVDQQTTIQIGVVHSVKEGIVAALREGGIKALQSGGPLDDVIEAEVVDDSDT